MPVMKVIMVIIESLRMEQRFSWLVQYEACKQCVSCMMSEGWREALWVL